MLSAPRLVTFLLSLILGGLAIAQTYFGGSLGEAYNTYIGQYIGDLFWTFMLMMFAWFLLVLGVLFRGL